MKVVACLPDGSVRHRALIPNRGHPSAALLSAVRNLSIAPSTACEITATGGGIRALENLFACRAVNEVPATALAVIRRYPRARTVIGLGGQSRSGSC